MGGKPRNAAGGGPQLTPEMLERFRQVGLRLDRQGRFWHRGAEVTHPRLRLALLRWLDVREEDDRPIIRLDARRYAYVDVDDAMLLVTSIRWDGDRAVAHLNDDTEEELAYDTLAVAGDGTAYCKARGARLPARLVPSAFLSLAEHIVEQGSGFALEAAGALHPIAQASGIAS